MDLLVVNEGRLATAAALTVEYWSGIDCRLFTNDVEIVADSVVGDLVEPSWTGYAPVATTGHSEPFINGDGKAQVDCDPVSWTNTSGADVSAIGFFMVDGDGLLYAARRFDSPLTFPDGVPITFPVSFTDTGDPEA